MTTSFPPPTASQIARLCDLVSLGAGFAGTALGHLLRETVVGAAVRAGDPREALAAERPGGSAIVFEAKGDVSGLVAIALSPAERSWALERLLGRCDPDSPAAESALCELGNIVASHSVSAIADELDATVMLSVPRLLLYDAESALLALVARRGPAFPIEAELCDADGDRRALLVFALDLPDSGGF